MANSQDRDVENSIPRDGAGKGQNHVENLARGYGLKDPNSEIEEERWKLIKDRIISKGGVVVAEHLAPFLDPLPKRVLHEEAYMFPVLIKFQGRPVMDDQSGHVLYHFESLNGASGEGRAFFTWSNGGRVPDGKFLEEKKWDWWNLQDFCLTLVQTVVLGLFARWVYNALHSESPSGFVKYFIADVPVIPILHFVLTFWVVVGIFQLLFCVFYPIMKNVGVNKRNGARQQAALKLQSPNEQLRTKLQHHA
ncbi:PREDICTED: uncharacterized protein At5g03900, chloroplastic-like [Fragaria vesca subsp. vesca]